MTRPIREKTLLATIAAHFTRYRPRKQRLDARSACAHATRTTARQEPQCGSCRRTNASAGTRERAAKAVFLGSAARSCTCSTEECPGDGGKKTHDGVVYFMRLGVAVVVALETRHLLELLCLLDADFT